MSNWISVKEHPLYTEDDDGWGCTPEGEGEFIAAVPYESIKQPGKQLWWIRHCVVEDGIGLCVVGDDDNEPAGWDLTHVTHWQPLPEPPKTLNDPPREETAPSPLKWLKEEKLGLPEGSTYKPPTISLSQCAGWITEYVNKYCKTEE